MPHYSKAPITEAIIDLRTRLPADFVTTDLRKIQEAVADKYVESKDILRAAFQFKMSELIDSQAVPAEKIGCKIVSRDEKRVLQTTTEGFTFSWLTPYQSWEAFKREARQLWAFYREITKPLDVTRIAVRYINRLDLPTPFGDFKEFIRTYPEVSPDLPQGLLSYFMQMQIPYPDIGALLILSQGMVPPPQAGIISVALDIDLSIMNPKQIDDDSIWEAFERLRDKKNEIFEGCITDATRRVIS